MKVILTLGAICLGCLCSFGLYAQEIHLYRNHILYHSAPKGKIVKMNLQEFRDPYTLMQDGLFTVFNYSKEGKLQGIEALDVQENEVTTFAFQHLNDQEISWKKKRSMREPLSGKIILEKEGEQLKKISNFEAEKRVEVTEYFYEEEGTIIEVIHIYTGTPSRTVNTYKDDRLSSSVRHDADTDKIEMISQYSYVGDTINIKLYDSNGILLQGSDMRSIVKKNNKGAWREMERQFVLPHGDKFSTYRQIEYADDDQLDIPSGFTPGNWYSFLFKPNLLFFEFNEDGTYDFGFQSVILDNGTYQLKENQLLLQSAKYERKGAFEVIIESSLLSFSPIQDTMQFFYPFISQLAGEDPYGKMDQEEYEEFLRLYMRFIYGD